MAVTIDATAGGANANSYMTLAQADAYVEAMINSTDVSKWSTGNEDSRNRALAAAAQRLDRERFIGARATNTQALQWPRTGVRKPDTYVNTYATGFRFAFLRITSQRLRFLIRSSVLRSSLLFTCTTTLTASAQWLERLQERSDWQH